MWNVAKVILCTEIKGLRRAKILLRQKNKLGVALTAVKRYKSPLIKIPLIIAQETEKFG